MPLTSSLRAGIFPIQSQDGGRVGLRKRGDTLDRAQLTLLELPDREAAPVVGRAVPLGVGLRISAIVISSIGSS